MLGPHTLIPRLHLASQGWIPLLASGDGIRLWGKYVNEYVDKGCHKADSKPQIPDDSIVKDPRPFIRSPKTDLLPVSVLGNSDFSYHPELLIKQPMIRDPPTPGPWF